MGPISDDVRPQAASAAPFAVATAPDGRVTRFMWGEWPASAVASASSATATATRDILIHTHPHVSALASYIARQQAMPDVVPRVGAFAVIDASEPGQIRLLRDGWVFRYAATDCDLAFCVHACAAFVGDGYALHDALCLALAHAAVQRDADAGAGGEVARGSSVPRRAALGVSDRAMTGAAIVALPVPPLTAFPGVAAPLRLSTEWDGAHASDAPFDENAPLTTQASAASSVAIDRWGDRTHAVRPRTRPEFPRCAGKLGLYPIAPSAEWVERLVAAGARTIQLRIKVDLAAMVDAASATASRPTDGGAHAETLHASTARANGEAALRDEIRHAVRACRQAPAPVQLFINDHWQLAIEAGAYGVHLGQEDLADLPDGALDAIASAGLRLGVSTHGYYEMLLALPVGPSYIACGPLFATTTKAVAVPPQGVRRLTAYCRLLHDVVPPTPVVAIGGIRLAHLTAVRAAGAASAAVVGAVINAETEMDRNVLARAISALQAAFNG